MLKNLSGLPEINLTMYEKAPYFPSHSLLENKLRIKKTIYLNIYFNMLVEQLSAIVTNYTPHTAGST